MPPHPAAVGTRSRVRNDVVEACGGWALLTLGVGVIGAGFEPLLGDFAAAGVADDLCDAGHRDG